MVQIRKHIPTIAAFIVCWMYWIYLIFHSQMVIEHDARGYEYFGSLINHKGWIEYIRTGPNREPVYPFLIALSMRISEHFSILYQLVQRILQIFILFSAQLLLWQFLKELKINRWLTAIMIAYFGISPSIINSSLILFSEIVAYPLVLLVILLSCRGWLLIQEKEGNKFIFTAIGLGLVLALLTLAKGAFEIIGVLLLMPFGLLAIKNLFDQERKVFQRSIIFLLISFLFFYTPIVLYKSLNKKYNGQFVLTDRGSWALYGNTARRMQPLTPRQWLAALAFVPSWQFCTSVCTQPECEYWSFIPSDKLGADKRNELSQVMSPNQVDHKLFILSIQKILENPVQYFLLMIIESLKMFFWEFPWALYVIYPAWIYQVYQLTFLQWFFYLAVPIVTFMTVMYLVKFVWRHQTHVFSKADESISILFFITVFMTSFMFVHSFFFILSRYILLLSPLYLISTAVFIQHIFLKKSDEK